MSGRSERLSRFVAECRDDYGSTDQRLAELDDLADEAARGAERDLRLLSALASGTRYRLARALVAADGELCVCELHPLTDVGESAVSRALSELRDAGLVARREDGRWHYYRATDAAVRLIGALDGIRETTAGDGPTPGGAGP